MARSGKSPYLGLEDVHRLGFAYALCPIEPMFAMHKAVREMMTAFMAAGCNTDSIAHLLTPFDDFNRFVGMDEVVARERSFREGA